MATKVDIWMPLSIGDYLADTSHLSTLEHGAYLLMLMHYWRKGPLPNDSVKLANICKMSPDAWSMVQAVLMEFLSIGEDGLLHQTRADRERAKWMEKKDSAQEKAKKAAKARWDNAPSNAPSIPQAMLDSCPSSLPLPIEEQKQIPSPKPRKRVSEGRKKKELVARPTKTDFDKERHRQFKTAIFSYWRSKNQIDCPWGQPEGRQLEIWLRANPAILVDEFTAILRNRFKSEVNHSERPSKWIRNVTDYATGPLDRFGKPIHVANGKPPEPLPKSDYELAREQAMRERAGLRHAD